MPELPDLQVFSRNLTRKLSGMTLQKVKVLNGKKLNVSAKKLSESLEGQKLVQVFRDGKELHFEFKNGNVLGLHLMLRGELYIFENKNDRRFTIIELHFKDGVGLAMTDYQGQATPALNPEPRQALDALSKEVNFAFLKELLGRSKAIVKNLLLDQKMIRGIGNAYVDEILWEAGISPFSVSNKIPEPKVKALAKSIKAVLQQAEKNIIKTNPDIISGEVRDFLKIHNFKKTHSPTGAAIEVKTTGARKTYFTQEQELFE
ncbi:MAG: DNA-formamidopyrimidine glycosylase family protein [Bacteroidota bacterium]